MLGQKNKRWELPGRFEYGTETWRTEAVAFLNREIAKTKKSLFRDDLPGESAGIGDEPFTLCETFTNAPEHLGLKGNVASWTLYYDGDSFTATDDLTKDADVLVTGDYQAALFMAQVVGSNEPGRMEAAYKLMRHTFGDALQIKGKLNSEASKELLGKMHDFLARRTVDNPDLAHRAERLGLVDHIRELDELGYTVVEKVLPDDFTDALREAVLKHTSILPTDTMPGLLQYGRLFEDLVLHPATLTIVDATLGRGAILGYSLAGHRGPGKGVISLHSDDNMPDPYPAWALTTNCLYALDDWSGESAGPTWVIPGSHKMRRSPDERDEQKGGVPIKMPKGSMLVLTSGVWHWQGDRIDPGRRVTLNAHYFRNFVRPHEPLERSQNLLFRNPPRMQELMGMDDGFEKGDIKGRDYKRFQYMSELNSFNEARKLELLTPEPVA